jgi:hypothetical protein
MVCSSLGSPLNSYQLVQAYAINVCLPENEAQSLSLQAKIKAVPAT